MDITFVAIHLCVLRQPVTLCRIHMGFNEIPKMKPGGGKERDSMRKDGDNPHADRGGKDKPVYCDA
jgi:hypothetical protein